MGEVHELQQAENDTEADREQKIQHPQTDAVQYLEEVDHELLLKPDEWTLRGKAGYQAGILQPASSGDRNDLPEPTIST